MTVPDVQQSSESLREKQQEMENEINDVAATNNLSSNSVWPITDGVCDFDAYLKSFPKIMWILKEPYDDFTDENPSGGGWSIPMNCFPKDDAWKCKSWQTIIYVMYGFLHNLTWNEMEYISDDTSMADVLKQMVYLNVNKMPGYQRSNVNELYKAYTIWKDILRKQRVLYAPDVIIFGNTFEYFKDEFAGTDIEEIQSYNGLVAVYKKGKTFLLDAYHPCRKGRDYVNSLITALGDIKKEMIKTVSTPSPSPPVSYPAQYRGIC